jgi:hypothetical protein
MDQMTAGIHANTEDGTFAIDASCISSPSFTEALVDPVNLFRDPTEVVEHPWFTHEEKRTILLSWARNELLLEQVANKTLPELKPRSRIDAVIEALARFDAPAAGEYLSAVAAIRASHLRRPFKRAMPVG